MDYIVKEVAERIKGMRTILDISAQEMADVTGVTLQDYEQSEEGLQDFSFTFLYKCAKRFGLDITELLTGDMPKLSFYSIVRAGEGLPIERRKGFQYRHLAYLFRNKIAEPFVVTARFSQEEQNKPIALSTHQGQEMDYVLKGSLLVQLEDKQEILNAGDTIYYDSARGHGMVAVGGEDCQFLAIVMRQTD